MRIIGGRDYYDSGMAWGRDDKILFLRNGDRRATTREMHEEMGLPYVTCGVRLRRDAETAPAWSPRWLNPRDQGINSIEVRRDGRMIRHEVVEAHVVLCGTLHNGIHVRTVEPYGCQREIGARWLWSAEALRSYAGEWDLHVDEGQNRTQEGYGTQRSQAPISVIVEDLETWFAPRAIRREGLVSAKVTIASMNPLERHPYNQAQEPLSWRIDQGSLAEMDFAKAVDPYTAFQEISMWKGGVLPSEGPAMVEITDDKVKIAKHGFHHPTSFRKSKQNV